MDENFQDLNKLPELKLGTFRVPDLICVLVPKICNDSICFDVFICDVMLDAKQAQGFLSFFKTLPRVSKTLPPICFPFFQDMLKPLICIVCLLLLCFQDPRAIRFFDRRVSSLCVCARVLTRVCNVDKRRYVRFHMN